jgi:hypothetical protein
MRIKWLAVGACFTWWPLMAASVDLRSATVCLPPDADAVARKAAVVLVEEVEKRSGLRLPLSKQAADGPAILLERGRSGSPAEGAYSGDVNEAFRRCE